MHPLQRPDIASDAIVSIVTSEHLIEMVHLFLERQVPHLPHLVLQSHERAPQTGLFRTHTDPKVAFLIAGAVQGKAQKNKSSLGASDHVCWRVDAQSDQIRPAWSFSAPGSD